MTTNVCSEAGNPSFLEMWQKYLDDELDPTGSSFIEGHILNCPFCRAVWEAHRLIEETPHAILDIAQEKEPPGKKPS